MNLPATTGKRPPARRLLTGLALVSLFACSTAALVAGCAQPACRHDVDCGPLQGCRDGTCAPLDLQAAQRGTCEAPADCPVGERCVEGRCVEPVEGPPCRAYEDETCGAGEVCTVDPSQPCVGSDCAAALHCRPKAGPRRGAFACTADTDCETAVCHEGVCLRPCLGSLGCPIAGFICAEVTRPEGVVSTCVGVSDDGTLDRAASVCDGPGDCPDGRDCRFFQPAVDGHVITLCLPPVPGGRPSGATCETNEACASSWCAPTCRDFSVSELCEPLRCHAACEEDADCPDFERCQSVDVRTPRGNTGTPIDLQDSFSTEGSLVEFCSVTLDSCHDDVDCCPSLDAEGHCERSGSLRPAWCAPRRDRGRLLSECRAEDRGAPAGAACAAGGDCATGLCVETAAGRVCTSLCDRFRDRCATRTLPASTCQETELEVDGQAASLFVCR